ncbi:MULTISPECIES: DUF397 domain-containing protein [unclassified Streptomyces]|uniref:DUF397 domain-containing protein n=1 Tax=unclassified Streptomyces TaxID=2593676 RepID=UPI0033A08106
MSPYTWQKSSYCQEGDVCVHLTADPGTIHLTGSADPTHSVLITTPTAFAALLDVFSAPRPGR